MNPDFPEKLEDKIETLCGQGCAQVNQLIDDARNGGDVEALSGFSDNEVAQIIDELSEIMAIYEG
ncbi:MAG TPA: hypothetical protein ENJ87_11130 [Gammaproteobacteria bacterium]|nr:hypothetical protein [Gammaproteobacteria bacterium]